MSLYNQHQAATLQTGNNTQFAITDAASDNGDDDDDDDDDDAWAENAEVWVTLFNTARNISTDKETATVSL